MAEKKKSVVDDAKELYEKGKKAVTDYVGDMKSIFPDESDLRSLAEKQKNTSQYKDQTDKEKKAVPSYKHGTSYVPKTGLALLHEGEKVVPKAQNPAAAPEDDGETMEHPPEERSQFHRSLAKLNKGGLHRHFGVAEDQPLTMQQKREAANSDNPHVAKMGHLAVAMHSWKKGKK